MIADAKVKAIRAGHESRRLVTKVATDGNSNSGYISVNVRILLEVFDYDVSGFLFQFVPQSPTGVLIIMYFQARIKWPSAQQWYAARCRFAFWWRLYSVE